MPPQVHNGIENIRVAFSSGLMLRFWVGIADIDLVLPNDVIPIDSRLGNYSYPKKQVCVSSTELEIHVWF